MHVTRQRAARRGRRLFLAVAVAGLYLGLLELVLLVAVGGSLLAERLRDDLSLLVTVPLASAAVGLATWLLRRGHQVIRRVVAVLHEWACRAHRVRPSVYEDRLNAAFKSP
jgi:hypothetical protein